MNIIEWHEDIKWNDILYIYIYGYFLMSPEIMVTNYYDTNWYKLTIKLSDISAIHLKHVRISHAWKIEGATRSSVAGRCLKRRSEIDFSKRRELSLEQSAKEEPVKKNTDTSDTKSQAWFNGYQWVKIITHQ